MKVCLTGGGQFRVRIVVGYQSITFNSIHILFEKELFNIFSRFV